MDLTDLVKHVAHDRVEFLPVPAALLELPVYPQPHPEGDLLHRLLFNPPITNFAEKQVDISLGGPRFTIENQFYHIRQGQ